MHVFAFPSAARYRPLAVLLLAPAILPDSAHHRLFAIRRLR